MSDAQIEQKSKDIEALFEALRGHDIESSYPDLVNGEPLFALTDAGAGKARCMALALKMQPDEMSANQLLYVLLGWEDRIVEAN